MEYRTVFDVVANGVRWVPSFLILLGASVFVLIGWALRQSDERESGAKGIFFQAIGGIGFLGGLAFLTSAILQYRSASEVLSGHQCSQVEGVVSDFIPMPPGGHSEESFRIKGITFSYESGWGSTYFNSESNNGSIHDGIRARITYRGSDILKVEVQQ